VYTRPNEISEGFHSYGVMVNPDFITMYFDGVDVWKTRTPPEHQRPLMMLLNLALGSGWPIDKVPDPSCMYVEYVRAYAKDGASTP
jgi:beta-glucanase (GH16 family)